MGQILVVRDESQKKSKQTNTHRDRQKQADLKSFYRAPDPSTTTGDDARGFGEADVAVLGPV